MSKAEVEFISQHTEDLEMLMFFSFYIYRFAFSLDVAELQRDGNHGEMLSKKQFHVSFTSF